MKVKILFRVYIIYLMKIRIMKNILDYEKFDVKMHISNVTS